MEPVDMALTERYRRKPSRERYEQLVRLAAAGGNDAARDIHATWLLRGFKEVRLRPDVPAGIRLLRLASRSNPHAMVELARRYEEGTGVPRDLPRARRLLQKACRYGSVFARIHLAWIYGEGVGVPRDPRKARRLMQEAARLGLAIDGDENIIESLPAHTRSSERTVTTGRRLTTRSKRRQ